jgi:hypothetical protein
MKKEEQRKKVEAKVQNKVIDGSNLGSRRAAGKSWRAPIPPGLVELQPKAVNPSPGPPLLNENLCRAFKNGRVRYTEVLRQRFERLTHIRDVIKKRGFAMAATEVAANGEGALELMSVLQAKPDAIRTDNAAVCIDALQFGFEKDPEMGVNVLGIILESVGGSISVVAGDEYADKIMETIHGIAPVVRNAAVRGVHGAQELLEQWNKLLW